MKERNFGQMWNVSREESSDKVHDIFVACCYFSGVIMVIMIDLKSGNGFKQYKSFLEAKISDSI
jgi:hypothetical protein